VDCFESLFLVIIAPSDLEAGPSRTQWNDHDGAESLMCEEGAAVRNAKVKNDRP
jgi:hypothetical protein